MTVLLHRGVYELSQPLTFGPPDSGTAEFAITYAAVPGETVVLSGGRRITNWRENEHGGWTATLPDVKTGKWFFRQLIVNDRRAVRARWPEQDGILRIASVEDDVQRFTFNQPLPWENLAGQRAEMVVYENWSITRGLVTGSDEKQLTTATPMGWIGHGNATTASPGKPVYLEHARAFLDTPGEWFLDHTAGVLHYRPREGEDPAAVTAVAPRLERLIVIAGTKETPVRNLHFEGIRLEHVDFPLPAFGYNGLQAAHYGTKVREKIYVHPVAVECAWAEDCRFERCRFAHLNGSGIGFGPGCRANAVSGCILEDIGGNGVMIGWRGTGELELEKSLDADWADPADAPTGNEVSNCHLRRCGVDSRGAVAVFVAFAADTRIAHNLIHDMPYTGISIGYRWNTMPSTQTGCIVEYNHIYDVMTILSDGGGIYTLGRQPGTILRGNHIHDVHGSRFGHGGAPNNGIFIDQGSKEFLFDGNVVYAAAGGAMRFHQSTREWHQWTDNHFDIQMAAPGKIGSALRCDGTRNFVEVGHAPALEPEQITLEAWTFLTQFPGTNESRRWIVNKNQNEWAEGHYALMINADTVGAYLNIGGGRHNVHSAWSPEGALKLNRWQHLAATYDGAALKVYANGTLVGTTAVNRKRVPGQDALAIGRRQDGYNYFKGALDEVRIYDRALDAAELRGHHGKPAPVDDVSAVQGLVGYWSFDDLAPPAPAIEEVVRKAGLEPAYRDTPGQQMQAPAGK